MPKLPAISGKQTVVAFEKDGWVVDRIKGSHHIMKKEGQLFALSVPVHSNEDIASGTLRSLIRTAGLTVEEFIELLD